MRELLGLCMGIQGAHAAAGHHALHLHQSRSHERMARQGNSRAKRLSGYFAEKMMDRVHHVRATTRPHDTPTRNGSK